MDRRVRRGHARALVVAWVAMLLLSFPAGAGPADEPERVVVQHVLVSFKGRIRGKEIPRNKREAKVLALDVFQRARDGEDFDGLVKEHTDDRYPGIYVMTNRGLAAPPDGFSRDQMAANFGDVAFGLEIGEIGIANFHPGNSPYGWHVIKRLE